MLGFAPLCTAPLCAFLFTTEDNDGDTNQEIATSFTLTTDRALPTVFTTTRTFPEING
jgi:hypothetical protein